MIKVQNNYNKVDQIQYTPNVQDDGSNQVGRNQHMYLEQFWKDQIRFLKWKASVYHIHGRSLLRLGRRLLHQHIQCIGIPTNQSPMHTNHSSQSYKCIPCKLVFHCCLSLSDPNIQDILCIPRIHDRFCLWIFVDWDHHYIQSKKDKCLKEWN